MQSKHQGILRAVNSDGKYNILTFPTHEAYQSNWSEMPHTFYLYQGQGIKPWSNKYRQLPKNHVLLDGSQQQIKNDMQFDIVLSQNKFGQFQVAQRLAYELNLPLINIEHTLPVPEWTQKQRDGLKQMRGKLNIFISEFSIDAWGFDRNDPTVRVIRHGINTRTFTSANSVGNTKRRDGKILTVVNDWINRDWCCGWSIYQRVTKDLPVNPVGDTPGFSKPADGIDDLVSKYQNASVFLNTSTISPVPTALLEAMSCGCPIVTTATCMIPEIIKDGVNGFISNDESYLREKLIWCLNNPEEAAVMGENARKTILEEMSLEKHCQKWMEVFKEVYGTGFWS